LTPVSASFALNSSPWNGSTSGEFYTFGFTTTKDQLLSQFTVGLRSSGTGPGFVDLLYAKDGSSSFTQLGGPIKLFANTFNNYVADLSSIGVVHSSLTLEFVADPNHKVSAAFNSGTTTDPTIGPNGTFRFASFSPGDNTFLNPEITGQAVPEPSTALMAGAGIVLVGLARARRRRGVAQEAGEAG
jgi:hypothetical protein